MINRIEIVENEPMYNFILSIIAEAWVNKQRGGSRLRMIYRELRGEKSNA